MLHELGLKYKTDKATFHKYLDFYEKKLPGRDFAGRLLEVGVMDGASMRMWREYVPARGFDVQHSLLNNMKAKAAWLL